LEVEMDFIKQQARDLANFNKHGIKKDLEDLETKIDEKLNEVTEKIEAVEEEYLAICDAELTIA